jgi:hemoglobin
MRAIRLLPLALLACVALGLTISCAQQAAAGADEPMKTQAPAPLERKALDETVYKTLREVINKGADLYNAGDTAGCYRLYEGALMATEPLLDHRPNLQKDITAGLAKAAATPFLDQRAFVLREVIDKVRTDLRGAAPMVRPQDKSLWDALGGEKVVGKIVRDLVEAAMNDPKVNLFRGKEATATQITNFEQAMLAFISYRLKGPIPYLGKSMKEAHKGMRISEAEFDAFRGHFKKALEQNEVKAADIDYILKEVVDRLRGDIVEPPTAWDQMGGEKVATRVVDEFVDAVLKDPKIKFFRDPLKMPTAGEIDLIKRKIIDLISSATDGPFKYNARSLVDTYRNQGITDAEYTLMVGYFKKALEGAGVKPAQADFLRDRIEAARKEVVEGKPEVPSTEDRKTYALKGKVTLDGKPLPAGKVVLFSKDRPPVGTLIQADGTYSFKGGIVSGVYRIVVQEPDTGALLKIPMKYTDPDRSGIDVDVKMDMTADVNLVSK